MKILKIEDIDPTLEYPGFWSQKRLYFLKFISTFADGKAYEKKIIRRHQLPNLAKHIEEQFNKSFVVKNEENEVIEYRLNTDEKRELNEILEQLQNNDWICSYFFLNQKPHRPSVMPSDQLKLSYLAVLQEKRELFWAGKLLVKEHIPLMLLIEILVSSGASSDKLKTIIKDGTLLVNGHISIPIIDGVDKVIRLPLSARARLLLNWVKRYKPFDLSDSETLWDWLKESFNDISDTLLWAASHQIFLEGIEAVIFSQLQRNQLPVPLPSRKAGGSPVFRYTSKEFTEDNFDIEVPKIIPRVKEETENYCYEFKTLANLDTPTVDIESVVQWQQESLNSIGQIYNQLRRFLTDDQGVYKNGTIAHRNVTNILYGVKRRTLERAKKRAMLSATSIDQNHIEQAIDLLEFSFTALDLALNRIRIHLIDRGNTLDTCWDEIRSLFKYGLLRYQASHNLENWDDDDIEALVSDYLFERKSQRKVSEESRIPILQSLYSLIRYGQEEHDVFRAVESPITITRATILTKRNHVFGPTEFDRIKTPDNPVCVLAFYGGMRSGEIANLTLNDIVSSKDEFVIYIKKGKTPSARRSIPLHLIAPPEIVQKVRDYYEYRLIHFRAYKKKSERSKVSYFNTNEVPLLSANNSCNTNTAASVVRHALAMLQSQAGSGADLHLLRHSFASMMFLRWYCCKYPDLVKQLVDQKHWCFTQKGLAELKIFFGEKPDVSLPHSNITAIVHLIKLMGHKNTDTFFKVYVHSYDVVLEHALRRTHEKNDQMALPGKLIAELIPSMRSRKSQLNLQSRKLSKLADILESNP